MFSNSLSWTMHWDHIFILYIIGFSLTRRANILPFTHIFQAHMHCICERTVFPFSFAVSLFMFSTPSLLIKKKKYSKLTVHSIFFSLILLWTLTFPITSKIDQQFLGRSSKASNKCPFWHLIPAGGILGIQYESVDCSGSSTQSHGFVYLRS